MTRVWTAAIVVTFAALVALAWAVAGAGYTEPNVLIEGGDGGEFSSIAPNIPIDTGGSGEFTRAGNYDLD